MAVVGTVVIAGVAGGFGGDGGGDPQSMSTSATALTSTTVPVTAPIAIESTEVPQTTTHLSQPLGLGMAGEEVRQVQERLDELGFFVGEIDGQFGPLFQQALWAYQKLVLNVPRDEAKSVLTDELWQDMQRRHPHRADALALQGRGHPQPRGDLPAVAGRRVLRRRRGGDDRAHLQRRRPGVERGRHHRRR